VAVLLRRPAGEGALHFRPGQRRVEPAHYVYSPSTCHRGLRSSRQRSSSALPAGAPPSASTTWTRAAGPSAPGSHQRSSSGHGPAQAASSAHGRPSTATRAGAAPSPPRAVIPAAGGRFSIGAALLGPGATVAGEGAGRGPGVV